MGGASLREAKETVGWGSKKGSREVYAQKGTWEDSPFLVRDLGWEYIDYIGCDSSFCSDTQSLVAWASGPVSSSIIKGFSEDAAII